MGIFGTVFIITQISTLYSCGEQRMHNTSSLEVDGQQQGHGKVKNKNLRLSWTHSHPDWTAEDWKKTK